jgi:hypothetical protein
MATSAYNKFNVFVDDLAHGKHIFGTDVIKVMLTNTAPVAANAVKADIIDIAAGNGYTAGGNTLAFTSASQAAGVEKVIFADSTFTATGAFATFRYAVLYNDTTASPVKPLICWFDYGSAISMTNLETFIVDLDQVAGLFTIT